MAILRQGLFILGFSLLGRRSDFNDRFLRLRFYELVRTRPVTLLLRQRMRQRLAERVNDYRFG